MNLLETWKNKLNNETKLYTELSCFIEDVITIINSDMIMREKSRSSVSIKIIHIMFW